MKHVHIMGFVIHVISANVIKDGPEGTAPLRYAVPGKHTILERTHTTVLQVFTTPTVQLKVSGI